MNERGQYGRRIGAEPPPSQGASLKTVAIVSAVVIGGAMLLARSARTSYRQHDRELYAINRPRFEGA